MEKGNLFYGASNPLEHRKVKAYEFESLIGNVKVPDVVEYQDVVELVNDFTRAADRGLPIVDRFKAFIRGENKLGRRVGRVLDVVTIFLPWGNKIEAVRTVINRKAKPRTMPRLKERSTKEGVAVIIGLLAMVGIELDAVVLSENIDMIIQGGGVLIAGVAGLMAYIRRERLDDDIDESLKQAESSAPSDPS